MNKIKQSYSAKAGMPPGTLIHVGTPRTTPGIITIFDYWPGGYSEKTVSSVSECLPYRSTPTTTWINVEGIHDVKLIEEVGNKMGLHSLLMEDILNTMHLPKVDDYGSYLFFTMKMLGWNKARNRIVSEQISIVLSSSYVISFQEQEGDIFDRIREKIRTGTTNIRDKGNDFLVYRLVDTIVDNYFIITEEIGNTLEKLERRILVNPREREMHLLQRMQKDLFYMRRSTIPLLEAVTSLGKGSSRLIDSSNAFYFRDIADHVRHLIDNIETNRNMLNGMRDVYMSSMSHRMNNIMKVLTIITTIFIPLSFIASIYGMNFRHMPELDMTWTYPAVLILMLVIAGGMVYFFRRRRWV